MGFSDFITLFFLVAAVLIFFQLRSVLGRRTGNEKPPFDPYSPRDVAKGPVTDDNKVVTLPKRAEAEDENRFAEVDALAPADSALNASLREVMTKDPSTLPSLVGHPDYVASVPTPEHFLPLAYLAGLARAEGKPADVLVEGCSLGSISMTCYTLGAGVARPGTAGAGGATLPDPSIIPGEDTNT